MTSTVALVGATGAVGQRFVQLLDGHPKFEIGALTASPDSVGKPYRDAATWRLETPIPDSVADRRVQETAASALPEDVDLVFSSLPSDIAATVEPAMAKAGYVVSSNSSNDRMAADVPLVIPELNPDHLGLLDRQRETREWDGALVKNPNCSTIAMAPTLAALDRFGLERVHVATMQAVSGAGYSGVSSMEIIDNVVPHIDDEAAKMERETTKLLGTVDGGTLEAHSVEVSASCNRVPTIDGHLESVWGETTDEVTLEEAKEALQDAPTADLPSAPDPLIEVFDAPDRPQPRLDRNRAGGMGICVGGLRETETGLRYTCLAHNTLRGAAGASLLNGELLETRGYL